MLEANHRIDSPVLNPNPEGVHQGRRFNWKNKLGRPKERLPDLPEEAPLRDKESLPEEPPLGDNRGQAGEVHHVKGQPLPVGIEVHRCHHEREMLLAALFGINQSAIQDPHSARDIKNRGVVAQAGKHPITRAKKHRAQDSKKDGG